MARFDVLNAAGRSAAGSLRQGVLAFTALLMAVLIACSGAAPSEDDASTESDSFWDSVKSVVQRDPQENDGPAPSASVLQEGSASLDPENREDVASFELVLFENEDHMAGDSYALADQTGRPVVVNFWFPSCPPCVAEMPDIETAYQRYKDRVEFVGVQLVGLDTPVDGQSFVTRLKVNYAVGADTDGTITQNFKVVGFPTTVFLDANHKKVASWTGVLDVETLDELIGKVLQ